MKKKGILDQTLIFEVYVYMERITATHIEMKYHVTEYSIHSLTSQYIIGTLRLRYPRDHPCKFFVNICHIIYYLLA